MPDVEIEWHGVDDVLANMEAYYQKCVQAIVAVANYFAPIIESYAKTNAVWLDHTAHARTGLHAFVEQLANDVVTIWLSHGQNVPYGVYLELAHQEAYAIILPALQEHYTAIMKMLHEIFR